MDKLIDNFITKIMPYMTADNSPLAKESVLIIELRKFYDEAFCAGMENVIKEEK